MYIYIYGASLVAQLIKNLPAVQETWVWTLHQEDLLEKAMATHSSILFFFSLQYSCIENSMDRSAWWATVQGVAKSWTQLSN